MHNPASGTTIRTDSSRRNFWAAGLSLPVAGMASAAAPQTSPQKAPKSVSAAAPSARYRPWADRAQGLDGRLRVHDYVRFQRDSRAVDMGITYFDTAREVPVGQQRAHGGAALKASRTKIVLSTKSEIQDRRGGAGAPRHQPEETGHGRSVDIWYMHSRDTVAPFPMSRSRSGRMPRNREDPPHRHQHAQPRCHCRPLPGGGEVRGDVEHVQFHGGRRTTPPTRKLVDAGIRHGAMK